MYRVIQTGKDRGATLWCTTDEFDFLKRFCQYQIDSAIPEGLNDFWIVQTSDEKGAEEIVNKWWFPEFCKTHEIRKRTFEERMMGA